MTTQGLIPTESVLLVLSPHLDDAVLSTHALISEHGAVEIAVVFTDAPKPARHTSWDRLCGFGDSTEAVAARQEENERALDGLNVPQHFLGLLDGQYLDGPRPGTDQESVASFIADWLSQHGPQALIAAPAGAGRQLREGAGLLGAPRSSRRKAIRSAIGPLGGAALDARAKFLAPRTRPFAHPDHMLVRDAAAFATGDDPRSLILYEDLPYLWGKPADEEALRVARGLDAIPVRRDLAVDRKAKAQRVGAYQSQLGYMYAPHGSLDTAAGLPATERYWLFEVAP